MRIRPHCDYHDRDLIIIGGTPILVYEPSDKSWWVDLSEFGCPAYPQTDEEIEKCQNSWELRATDYQPTEWSVGDLSKFEGLTEQGRQTVAKVLYDAYNEITSDPHDPRCAIPLDIALEALGQEGFDFS